MLDVWTSIIRIEAGKVYMETAHRGGLYIFLCIWFRTLSEFSKNRFPIKWFNLGIKCNEHTAKLLFWVLYALFASQVPRTRIELVTPWFSVKCSTNWATSARSRIVLPPIERVKLTYSFVIWNWKLDFHNTHFTWQLLWVVILSQSVAEAKNLVVPI